MNTRLATSNSAYSFLYTLTDLNGSWFKLTNQDIEENDGCAEDKDHHQDTEFDRTTFKTVLDRFELARLQGFQSKTIQGSPPPSLMSIERQGGLDFVTGNEGS